jgi:hypothetical protein
MNIATSESAIQPYFKWIADQLKNKSYGEVTIKFTVCKGFVTDVQKSSIDGEHFSLPKEGN